MCIGIRLGEHYVVHMYPTVSDVLSLPVIRRGKPELVAGGAGVGRRVRWVHVAEIADIAHLLHGGELVLTTGIALPDDPVALTRYVDELAGVGAAGLVIELVRRWNDEVPAALRSAADRRSLPLVTLSRETRFVAVTEAVIALIRDAQLAELRAAEQVHETFTALTVSGAEPAEVLREVARVARLPVVLETLSHDVLGYDAAGTDPSELLADWRSRSRAVAPDRADRLRRGRGLAGHGGRGARQRLGPAGAGLPGTARASAGRCGGAGRVRAGRAPVAGPRPGDAGTADTPHPARPNCSRPARSPPTCRPARPRSASHWRGGR